MKKNQIEQRKRIGRDHCNSHVVQGSIMKEHTTQEEVMDFQLSETQGI